MPISAIRSCDAGPGTWRISEFEHEVARGKSELIDLKANYGFDWLQLSANSLSLRMSTGGKSSLVTMIWSGVSAIETVTMGGYLPAEDGRVGLFGIRLLSNPPGPLMFEVELDQLRVDLTADTLEIQCIEGDVIHISPNPPMS